ncbi:hypothetical protein TNCV_4478811 [Trichonephila clavipes]|nr:hypothetical protein TNCV_4478811 [Trichonephila clavipes]
MKKDEEGNAGRVGWGEPREGVEGTERTRSGRRGPQAPQHLVIQNPHFSTTVMLRSNFDEAHFWLNGYVNKQNCRIWSEANPQVYVETPLHPEKLTVWCDLWAGGILLQKR